MSSLKAFFALCAATALLPATSFAGETWCGSGRSVVFADIDWQSGAFVTEVVKALYAQGYGCQVDSVPGNSRTLELAVIDNDAQIFAEEWVGRSELWTKAVALGKVRDVGAPFQGTTEGWFVPAYVIFGDPSRGIAPAAPWLKSVQDLADPRAVKIFKDSEKPGKGRFVNCPLGWSCEAFSTAKLQAYRLAGSYANIRPESGAALDAEIASAYLQGKPILFYYWSPASMMGRYELVQLKEPPYAKACWDELAKPDGRRDKGCAFPSTRVVYGVNARFARGAPELVAVLEKATFSLETVNAALADMMDGDVGAAGAARKFLKDQRDVWGPWVSEDARAKILSSL